MIPHQSQRSNSDSISTPPFFCCGQERESLNEPTHIVGHQPVSKYLYQTRTTDSTPTTNTINNLSKVGNNQGNPTNKYQPTNQKISIRDKKSKQFQNNIPKSPKNYNDKDLNYLEKNKINFQSNIKTQYSRAVISTTPLRKRVYDSQERKGQKINYGKFGSQGTIHYQNNHEKIEVNHFKNYPIFYQGHHKYGQKHINPNVNLSNTHIKTTHQKYYSDPQINFLTQSNPQMQKQFYRPQKNQFYYQQKTPRLMNENNNKIDSQCNSQINDQIKQSAYLSQSKIQRHLFYEKKSVLQLIKPKNKLNKKQDQSKIEIIPQILINNNKQSDLQKIKASCVSKIDQEQLRGMKDVKQSFWKFNSSHHLNPNNTNSPKHNITQLSSMTVNSMAQQIRQSKINQKIQQSVIMHDFFNPAKDLFKKWEDQGKN